MQIFFLFFDSSFDLAPGQDCFGCAYVSLVNPEFKLTQKMFIFNPTTQHGLNYNPTNWVHPFLKIFIFIFNFFYERKD